MGEEIMTLEEQKQVSFSYRNLDRNTHVFDKYFNTDIRCFNKSKSNYKREYQKRKNI